MQLDNILNQWPAWSVSQRPKLVKNFAAGLNHAAVQISCGAENYVVKVFGSSSQSGEVAIRAQAWAADLGLAPRIIYQDPEWLYMVMQFVDEPASDSINTPAKLKSAGLGLRAMHAAQPPSFMSDKFSLLSFCDQYLQTAGEQASRYHAQLLSVLNEHQNDSTAQRFCHNDLVVANCFVSDQRALFIDWEFATLNNPWFDLAAVALYFKLSDSEAAQMVAAYDSALVCELNQAIFINAQIACLWLDMLWHLQKFGEAYWPELADKLRRLKRLALQREIAIT